MKHHFSIEWLFRECAIRKKPLNILLKGEDFPRITVVDLLLDDAHKDKLLQNIFMGVDTNEGIITCKGYTTDSKEEKVISFLVEDIEEVEYI